MLDWPDYRRQLGEGMKDIGKLSPETLKGYVALSNAGQKSDVLGAKIRELIALAVAVTVRCDGCIATHVDAARKSGATREEIAEALGVAVAINAGAALVYSARTLDAYAALDSAAG
ncbi:MAG: carboxymuconolactone decarboxylase family protein [Alphaproteobacteria bacterium]|nr:MAG: carboxymuconolactone decarboxylase family protein [Alphaproteobacteria bacterium]